MLKRKKIFGLIWAFSEFEEHPSFWSRGMFGCLAAYCHNRMVMLLAENPGDSQWKGQNYDFDIWNGILLPTEREHHNSLKKSFPNLVPHPVLPKWLYLPMNAEDFEDTAEKIAKRILRNDPLLGIYPKVKPEKKNKKRSVKKSKSKSKVKKKK